MRIGLVLLAVCAATPACVPGTTVDIAAERTALMKADRDFAADTAERGADGWADWFLASAVMFPETGRVDGRDAIRERMRAVFTAENPLLRWEPETAVVSASGDLGYTIGRWRAVRTGSDGAEEVLSSGNYVSVWRKNADGEWRVALDIGNDDSTEESASTDGG
jgi:ketosteroid isomerase-like protein